MSSKYKNSLDQEEKEILSYFEDNKTLHVSKPIESEKADALLAAKNFLKKSQRINIRMNEFDLNHIKRRAAQEGIPYQTLISSILHKYAAGYFS